MIALAAVIGLVMTPFMVALWIDAAVERRRRADEPVRDRPFDWTRDGM